MSIPPSMMVVDDEEELANRFKKLLKGSGFNSVSFTDPLLAQEHFSQNPQRYTLVVTELRMHGMQSIHLAKKKLRECNPDVKILLIIIFYSDANLNNNEYRRSQSLDVIKKHVKMTQPPNCMNNICFNTLSQ